MLSDKGSLWCRVLDAKYSGSVKRSDSRWWRDINSVCFGSGQGNWFNEAICRRVGDGSEVRFWFDDWTGGGSLKEKFPRLFNLSSQQYATVSEMGEWHVNSWEWNFSWNRNLLDREQIRIVELRRCFAGFSPKPGEPDRWVWVKESSGAFSVSSAYEFLAGFSAGSHEGLFDYLWASKAPSNSIALAWKVLIKKLQTKDELRKRNAIPSGTDTSCAMCSNAVESISHLFFCCPMSWLLWCGVLRWVGYLAALPCDGKSHLLQFLSICQGNKSWKRVFSLIWIATIGVIWYSRNCRIFKGEVVDWNRLLDLIQYRVWLWLKAKYCSFSYSLFEWISNPASCVDAL